jgi:transcription antitermination factor NusG
MAHWIAARCPSQRESAITERLSTEAGYAVYLPRARVLSPKTRTPMLLALYPTYFFVNLDLSPPWQAIRRQPGVTTVLMTGDQPSTCPEREILKLKLSERDGFVRLAEGAAPVRRFAIGEKVKIEGGALAGREATYTGAADKRRSAIVLVSLLGRQVAVRLSAHAIAALAG